MFATRRVVPSVAALRVLRQLAYVSSGSACGAAALWTEDCRQRTEIVKKIADNAKRIRQSPRYAHQAVAVAVADNYEDYAIGGLQYSSSFEKQNASKAPKLPSVVEREYEEARRREHRRVRRRGGSVEDSTLARGQPVHGLGEDNHRYFQGGTEIRSGPAYRALENSRRQSTAHLYASRNKTQDTVGADLQPSGYRRSHLDRHLAEKVYRRQSTDEVINRVAVGPTSFPSTTHGFITMKVESQRESHGNMGEGRLDVDHAPSMPVFPTSITLGAVQADVELFFNHPWKTVASASNTATRLMYHAVDVDAFDDVRSLVLWKLHVRRMSQQDLHHLLNSCGQLFRGRHGINYFELCVSLLLDGRLDATIEGGKPAHSIQLLGEALAAFHEEDPRTLAHLVLDPLSRTVDQRNTLGMTLEKYCLRLMDLGFASKAIELYAIAMDSLGLLAWDLSTQLSMLTAAIEQGHLAAAYTLLKNMIRHHNLDRCVATADKLIHACYRCKSHGMVVEIVEYLLRLSQAAERQLNEASIAFYCASYSFHRGLNDFPLELFSRLPYQIRRTYTKSIAFGLAFHMRTIWRATEDLTSVEEVFRRALEHQLERLVSTKSSFETLHNEMIQLSLRAGQSHVARAYLAKLEKRAGAGDRTFAIACWSASLKQDWNIVETVLRAAKENATIADELSGRLFNDVLRIFARHHTIQQTWNFVFYAIDNSGIKPDQQTFATLANSFISEGVIDLVEKCKEALEARGCDANVTPDLAIELMNTYYHRHRPRHAVVMWLCHNLSSRSPDLVGSGFEDPLKTLVRSAIAYDLRNNYGQNKDLTSSFGQQRLARLETTNGVPSPGHRWGETLFFSDENQPSGKHAFGSVQAADVERQRSQTPVNGRIGHTTQSNEGRMVYDDMILAFSKKEYGKVLQLYEENPANPGSDKSLSKLEVALEASLRLHKSDQTHAMKLVEVLNKPNGFHPMAAMGPLLLHQMYHLDPSDKKSIAKLRGTVLDYYRANEARNLPVKHFIGVTAADILINNSCPRHGLNLLDAMHQSKWAMQKPLDIVAMTVFLKGYAAIKSIHGIKWVVNSVLEQNMRIDLKFTTMLKKARDQFVKSPRTSSSNPVVQHLDLWRHQCIERASVQRTASARLGNKLVRLLVKLTNPQAQTEWRSVPLTPSRLQSVETSRAKVHDNPGGRRRGRNKNSRARLHVRISVQGSSRFVRFFLPRSKARRSTRARVLIRRKVS